MFLRHCLSIALVGFLLAACGVKGDLEAPEGGDPNVPQPGLEERIEDY